MHFRNAIAIALSTVPMFLAAPSFAQGDDAGTLFRRGVQLLDRGEVKAACERFQESFALDPAPGTLYNLAGCHERDHQLLLAHSEYLDLAARMEDIGKADKARTAREKATALEAKLSRFELVLPASNAPQTITLDGKELDMAAVHAPIFVSDGPHTFVFSLGRAQPITGQAVGVAGQVTKVDVPSFPSSTSSPTPAGATTTAQADTSTPASSRRSAGPLPWIVGGAGVALIGVGAFFGVQAFSEKSDANKACGPSAPTCSSDAATATAMSKQSDASTNALVSTVLTGVGVVGVGVGVFLLVTSHKKGAEQHASGWQVIPNAGPGNGGASLVGSF